jgi:hypothetical protein
VIDGQVQVHFFPMRFATRVNLPHRLELELFFDPPAEDFEGGDDDLEVAGLCSPGLKIPAVSAAARSGSLKLVPLRWVLCFASPAID